VLFTFDDANIQRFFISANKKRTINGF
jgi:hypothetical protein